MLGGGLGKGTMWLCPKCLQEHKLRDTEPAVISRACPIGCLGPRQAEVLALVKSVRRFMLSSGGALERRLIDEMKVAVDKFKDLT